MEIEPIYHLKIQAKFQEYVDNSISKTINLPNNFPVEQVRDIFISAWKLGCKGITIYRYGSREGQVLTFGKHERKKENSTKCPECKSDQIIAEKMCFICKECGYSKCNL